MDRRKIYVIDDNEDFSKAMNGPWLEGYDVATFTSAEEALTLIAECPEIQPSFIISDINMPVMSGIKFIRALKEKNHSIPVIAISGGITTPMAVEAFELGVCDFLQKPFNLNRFVLAIKRAERQAQLQDFHQRLSQQGFALIESIKQVLRNHEARHLAVENELFSKEPPYFRSHEEIRRFLQLVFDGERLKLPLDDLVTNLTKLLRNDLLKPEQELLTQGSRGNRAGASARSPLEEQ